MSTPSTARSVIEHKIPALIAVKHDRGEPDPRLHHLLSRWLEMALVIEPLHGYPQDTLGMDSLASMLIACPRLASFRLSPETILHGTDELISAAEWAGVASVIAGFETLDFQPLRPVGPRLRKRVMSGKEILSVVPDAACPNLEVLELAGRALPMEPHAPARRFLDFCRDLASIAPAVRVIRSQIETDHVRAFAAIVMIPNIKVLDVPGATLNETTFGEQAGVLRMLYSYTLLAVMRVLRSRCDVVDLRLMSRSTRRVYASSTQPRLSKRPPPLQDFRSRFGPLSRQHPSPTRDVTMNTRAPPDSSSPDPPSQAPGPTQATRKSSASLPHLSPHHPLAVYPPPPPSTTRRSGAVVTAPDVHAGRQSPEGAPHQYTHDCTTRWSAGLGYDDNDVDDEDACRQKRRWLVVVRVPPPFAGVHLHVLSELLFNQQRCTAPTLPGRWACTIFEGMVPPHVTTYDAKYFNEPRECRSMYIFAFLSKATFSLRSSRRPSVLVTAETLKAGPKAPIFPLDVRVPLKDLPHYFRVATQLSRVGHSPSEKLIYRVPHVLVLYT
ncbi:hypothetical protein BDK51DRAFT_46306 [Blyttiomyces helicus]|uniref:Uncharacterized protein n=1 Tax=Blyttiomyces helicus TaxID=388810 RepID=A0A4P9WBF7_9FUNG|nr:hypothetical protein BDK51DRAFT_46306 [Blyttiomyces helicus]|eukprot:RKO88498.1 hypothetical protein BDK51DRAFT_46306 [Blyttiomyces helicus]